MAKLDEKEFLEHLSGKILDGEEIEMDEGLKEVEAWDSLSVVSFLAMADVDYGSTINPLEAKTARTVRDLYDLVVEGAEG